MDCARNIITANFSGGGTSATTAPLWQWDYGQVLCITGIEDLPAAFEVHFSTNRTGGVSTTAVGADGQVTIPNVLLTIGKNLNAWIYLSDSEGEGETEYSILIPVKARPMPETYDAEVSGEFDDVVRQVSEYAQTAQTAADNAGASAAAAATSEANAAASASAAETAKTAAETAQGDAEDAQAAAETAAQTATEKAQQTAQDAAQAASDVGRAESAAGRAETAQTGAESAKADAETAAQGAAASASTATEKANLAGQAASAAAQSAMAAAQSAASIEGDVQIASQKAAEAQTAAGQAVTAKDAAVTAQQGAETAATNAGQSASTATTKAAEAAQSASNAADSETAAEAAAARAEQAAASMTVDSALSDSSVNPVQNKVITGELTQVKSQLEAIADNSYYAASLTWEAGGIDNATGQTNNDGSTTRSRVVAYMRTEDYYALRVTNNVQNAWILYYQDDYSFARSEGINANSSNNPRIINKVYPYFRLDYRNGLDKVKNIIVYKYIQVATKLSPVEGIAFEADGVINALNNAPTITWEQGTLSDATGNEGASSLQIRNVGYIEVTGGSHVRMVSKTGYVFDVYTWNSNMIYQGVSNDISAYALNPTEDIYIRIVLKDAVVSPAFSPTISPSEGSNFKIVIISPEQGGGVDPTPAPSIPSYWDGAINTAESSINVALSEDADSASFGFVTDTHVDNNRGYSGLLLNKVMTDCHIPVWFHGGDAVKGLAVITKENLIKQMNADFAQFADIENIGLRAIGNHDPAFGTSNYNYNLKNGEINHYYHGVDRGKYLQQYGAKKGYFYKDITKDKLRCIVLDIIPYESQVDANDLVTGSNKMWYHQFGSEQLVWFAETLKTVPDGYAVVVCSHIAPVSQSELKTLDSSWAESCPIDYMQCRKIAEAYALKSTYAFSGTVSGDTTGDSYNIDANFASAHGDFVCFFCGHTHKDFMLTLDNVNIIGTANDSKAVSSNASAYAPSKTIGTDTEHIIDFFCIKKTSKSVSVIRLGAYLPSNGRIRTFTY